MTWRTLQEWNSKGRHVTKGEKCKLKSPEGESLFHRGQTSKSKSDSTFKRVGYYQQEDYDYEYEHDYGEHMYGDH